MEMRAVLEIVLIAVGSEMQQSNEKGGFKDDFQFPGLGHWIDCVAKSR